MNTIAEWRTPQGGGVLATSRDGTLTGYGAHVLVVDDAIKNRAEAENPEVRDQIDEGLRNDAITRLTADGSVMLLGSRWHEDDPSGRALRRGWDHIHLKAITTREDGSRVALWPDVRSLEFLDSIAEDVGPYGFESLYQGNPIPPNNSLFPGVHTYDPSDGRRPTRVFIGVDLAYSTGSRADYTSLLVLGDYVDHYRVLDLVRGQWTIGRSKAEVRLMLSTYQDARAVSYVSGPEKGILNLLLEDGIQVERLPARYGKFTRAQRSSQAWALGRIRVDPNAKWCDAFVNRLRYFTGAEGELDDEVDALVSAYDSAEVGKPTGWVQGAGFTFGRRTL
jgi:phage terminase large subunit-like protein